MSEEVHFTISKLWNGVQDTSAYGDVSITLSGKPLLQK